MPRFLIPSVLLALPTASFACLWDYDTLKQERARFPDTLEVITGKFLRHSPEFYEWRIKDRHAKLKTDPSNPALHDDLAVAYAKTGQYAKAIATMEAFEKIAPGRYETYSNLGTFHFLAGDIPTALPLIDKALAINPDAHFGREKYQRWLGEYLLSKPGRTLPIEPPDASEPSDNYVRKPKSFSGFVRTKLNKSQLDVQDLQAAVKGVLGMMRFANHENPVLLEALGDLLAHDNYEPTSDAKRLAGRAYLKAAAVAPTPEAREKYEQLAKAALYLQSNYGGQFTYQGLATQFLTERADADRWYADLKAKELGWIESGADPETEFDKLYTEEPRLGDEPSDVLPLWKQIGVGWTAALVIGAGIGSVAALVLLVRFISRRRLN